MKASIALLVLTAVAALTVVHHSRAATARDGAQIYQTYCASCHTGGWQGAPVAGIKDEWQPRLAGGFDALFKRAKDGVGAMPPMGTCTDCSDAELKAAIDDMLKF